MRKIIGFVFLGLFLAAFAGWRLDQKASTSVLPEAEIIEARAESVKVPTTIPVPTGTWQEMVNGCQGTYPTRFRTLELGGRFYEFYCVACHGHDGLGYPGGFFPGLLGGAITSNNMQPAVERMMNTDVHPMATLLFEKDALAIISYIRVGLGKASMVCPGDVVVQVNP